MRAGSCGLAVCADGGPASAFRVVLQIPTWCAPAPAPDMQPTQPLPTEAEAALLVVRLEAVPFTTSPYLPTKLLDLGMSDTQRDHWCVLCMSYVGALSYVAALLHDER